MEKHSKRTEKKNALNKYKLKHEYSHKFMATSLLQAHMTELETFNGPRDEKKQAAFR